MRLAVLVLLTAPCAIARAQHLADDLGDPARPSEPNLVVSTPYGSDRVRIEGVPEGASEARHAPCELTLEPGRYRIQFERAGLSGEFELGRETLIVRGVPLNETELGIGIGLGAAGVIVLGVLGLLHEEFCLDLDASCRFGEGFLMLGLGGVSVLIGIGLSIDSIGGVDILPVPRLPARPRER